ncbi:MAG: MXAN_6577-like cysteine-rich protein [Polyangiales bacterium]
MLRTSTALLALALFALGCANELPVVGGDATLLQDVADAVAPDKPADADAAPPPDAPIVVRCSLFERNCDGRCTDLSADRTHCGACDRRCADGQACVAGTCQASCGGGETLCGDRCVDTRFAPADCGACGNRCALGQVCNQGRCAVTCEGAGGGVVECPATDGDRYCADTNVDRRNCGRCGSLCPLGQVCMGGNCQIACPPGQTNCAGTCVNAAIDRENCGACGNRCPAGQVCSMGACTLDCAAPLLACGDGAARRCVDAQVDPAHCGMCGNACAAGQVCRAGRCETVCPAGQMLCDGSCRDLQSDGAHCGRCGQACAEGEACRMGACAITCPTGFSVCPPAMGGRAYCAELMADARNCGTCGNACAAGQSCVGGMCMLVCRAPLVACGDQCRDTASDNAHCGMCNNGCPAGQACVMGRCAVTCSGAQSACGLACRDLQTDLGHCGMCDNACPTPANASASCAMGRCASTCNAGYADCDMNPATGCEADLRASTSHCGRCGAACVTPNATAACRDGECAVARCDAGRGDCDAMAANGCEVDTLTTAAHCGACGRACNLANATAACRAGACAVAACNAGFFDCDGDPSNGCEVNGASDNTNCGACRRACPSGQVCAAGACTFSCPSGQSACSDGCYTLATSTQHCGMCERACPARANAVTTCAAGACGFRCLDGFADCDTNPANGCEVDTRVTPAHCGGCGRACMPANATPSCAAGVCDVASCSAGFADCNMSAADGCEVDTRTTVAHCGACGRSCSLPNATPGCAAGACTVASCSTGFGDCDASPLNGCETDTRTSRSHCGMCGNACGTGQACMAGACSALASCRAILAAAPGSPNGVYTIDPDGPGGAAPLPVYCDMAGGGWTMVMMMGTSPAGTLGYNSAHWTTTSVLADTVTDPSMNVSMKNRAFNTLPLEAIRFCLGAVTSCVTETITATSALSLFTGAERSRGNPPSFFAPIGYGGGLGCNRNGFNVFDVGGGPARYRYGILLNNESACEGSVDGGRGFGGRGYYGTEISAGQGDGIVSTSHERGWVWVR